MVHFCNLKFKVKQGKKTSFPKVDHFFLNREERKPRKFVFIFVFLFYTLLSPDFG